MRQEPFTAAIGFAARVPDRSLVRRALMLILLMGTVLVSRLSRADDWPAWRGPKGTGVVDDKKVPIHWSAAENVRWRVPLPERGNSTPVVWGDHIFLTQAIETQQRRTLMCFSSRDGKLLWQSGVVYDQREPTNAQNPYCAASPVTDGQHVIACFGSAGVYCYDFEGHELWHRDFGPVDSWHGSGSSPVIYRDLCILNYGPGSNSALIACNLKTGETVWKQAPPKTATPTGLALGAYAFQLLKGNSKPAAADAKDPAVAKKGFADASESGDFSGTGGYTGSWSTPLVVHVNDHDELIVTHALAITAYEPESGKVIWTCAGLPTQVYASPVIGNNMVIATANDIPGGTRVVAVKLGGTGDVTKTHCAWQVRLPKTCVGSGVVAGDEIFLITDHGFAECLDLATGAKKWEKRLSGAGGNNGSWSSMVLTDDHLFIPNQAGEMFVLKASAAGEILATNSIGDEVMCASPAIANGQIYLRTYQALWRLGTAD
jgi:outer membrane protein assembly factor BamB